MIEASAVALNSGVTEIAAGSTRDGILLLRSVKRLLEQEDQPRFLLSISVEAARTCLKRVRLPDISVLVYAHGAVTQNTGKGACVLNLRVAKAYR